jgi:hypothetical protein
MEYESLILLLIIFAIVFFVYRIYRVKIQQIIQQTVPFKYTNPVVVTQSPGTCTPLQDMNVIMNPLLIPNREKTMTPLFR